MQPLYIRIESLPFLTTREAQESRESSSEIQIVVGNKNHSRTYADTESEKRWKPHLEEHGRAATRPNPELARRNCFLLRLRFNAQCR